MALGDGKPKEQHMCQLAAASRPATALANPTSAVSRSSAAGTLACPTSNAGVHEGYTAWREASANLWVIAYWRERGGRRRVQL